MDPRVFRAFRELEESIVLLDPLLELLTQMLQEVCGQLRFAGRYTNELRLRLTLERSAEHTATLQLPVPMLDQQVLRKLLELELNGRPPQAPVTKIRLELMPVEPRSTQGGLFLPSSPVPEKLEITLARIRTFVGSENVGAPKLIDTHRPDSFQLGALQEARAATRPQASTNLKLTFRRYRPPLAAHVSTMQGKPVKVASSLGAGRVVACAGPWHSSGDWWSPTNWARREWDVEVHSIGISRVYEDCLRSQWFVEGSYD